MVGTGKSLVNINPKNLGEYQTKFPHAKGEHTFVWAYDKRVLVWRKAKIVFARKRLNPPLAREPENEHEYDYYVHWEGYDRRLDSWVVHDLLREWESNTPPKSIPKEDKVDLEPPDQPDHDHAGMDEEWLKEHEENTKVRTIESVALGKYIVPTWYYSPYPQQVQNLECVHVCEWCLSFFQTQRDQMRHMRRCTARHPPGDEIYRSSDGQVSMWEIDGAFSRTFCENLCYLSKLFLDHKTLRNTVTFFLYYVLTEWDEHGCHIVGYFSKEKYSANNVSCILTLPQHQRKGYGKFLIAFSYALSIKEQKPGTPERPLSDLGKASYMAYWAQQILPILKECGEKKESIQIQEISQKTMITTTDIETCLTELGILKTLRHETLDLFWVQQDLYDHVMRLAGKPGRAVEMDRVKWRPYDAIMQQFEHRTDNM